MQKLAEICIRRPIAATMLILSLVVVGTSSFFRLGVDRFPAVDLPTVMVRTELPGAAPEEVETQVSQVLEEAVNTAPGIDELRSVSGNGTSIVIATFGLERDIDVAAQDVRDRVAAAVRRLPRDVRPPVVSKNDNDATPVLSVALAGPRTLRELSEFADKVVKVQLERSAGVGEISLVGGAQRAIRVEVDASRLAAYGLPITAVRDAIARQNAEIPGGNITTALQERSLRTLGRLRTAAEFEDLVVAERGGVPVRLRDVGRASDGESEERSYARLDGEATVVLEVRRQSGANTVAVIDAAKAALERAREQLPPDLELVVVRDQSVTIHAALEEIELHLVLGSILASLVVLAFLRNLRATLIAAVAIPTSVIATFAFMEALGFTLNSVTMLALVLMVGVVIDDAIVVLENIFRFVEEKGLSPFEAAREATREIGLAVLATTFSLVVIFVPVSFMSSISGRFLYQFGITAAIAILVSLLVSFTLTPMMAARWLRREDAHAGPRSRRGLYALIEALYLLLLRLSLRFRFLVLLLLLGVAWSAIPLYRWVRQDYLPSNVDEAEFEIGVSAVEGASLAAMRQATDAIEREIQAHPAVRHVLTTGGGSFLAAVNNAQLYVRIAPHAERTPTFARLWEGLCAGDPLAAWRDNYAQRDVMNALRAKLRRFEDVRISIRNPRSFNLGGGNWDMDFVVRGPELEPLAGYAEELRRRAPELGLVDADTTLKLDKPELRVLIDRARAADLGVASADLASALRLMVGGDDEVSRWRDTERGEDYDVELRLQEPFRTDEEGLRTLLVPGANGALVRLDNLARLEEGPSPSRIDRLDRQRQARLRATVGPGFALADRIEALREESKKLGMPVGYTTAIYGRGRELERTFDEFLVAVALSIVFMYMILAAQFESLVHPFTILLSIPLTVPFALLSLWYADETLNLFSALGILVLFGVVKKNAILQIDHMIQLRARGLERREAILEANRDRLRPILMTTLAFVVGMLPLALGHGPGAEERRAIAVVVIGGQTLALVLTLLATPIVYSYFDDLTSLLRRRSNRGQTPI
ncbi:MAG: efflux RND transporter permease subunit [Planctomycetes bacterium]|nr:efflux RND transporter permease subunit [Planctomycetota bacterium]